MIDGKAVATPTFLAGSGVLYNKDIFDKYNLKEPKTYDELVKVAQTLKDNKVIPFAMSAKDSWWPQFILYYATAEHVTAKTPTFNTDVMQGKAKFSENAGWLESFNIYKELGDKGFYAPNALGVGFDQNKASWLAGQTAMMPAVWVLEDSRKANLNLGFFNFPTTNDPNSQFMWGSYGGAMGINAQNKHAAEANIFMDWLFKKPNYIMLLGGLKVFPIEEGIDVSGLEPLFPKMAAAWASPKVMVGAPNDTWLPGVQEVMITGLQEITAGKVTVPDLLKKMDAATAKAIKEKK
jgi:ABC-type glycerol-3-phosphate transport system substrate-binding protein